MSRRYDPADQALAYFATEALETAKTTLARCVAVVKAREKASGPKAAKKRAAAASTSTGSLS